MLTAGNLKGEFGRLCNVPANWAISVSDFFLSESILTCLPVLKKNCQVHK